MEPVVLGIQPSDNQPVTLSGTDRSRGLYIIGKNGTGKTTLIEYLIDQDMQHDHGLCLLDPHGDLLMQILARVPRHREHDVILLDMADTAYPFGLNLYECQQPHDPKLTALLVDHVVQTFEKVWGDRSWGPRIEYVLRNTAHTILANPGMTMVEIPRLLIDEVFRAQLVAQVTNPQVRLFWDRYERKKLPDQDEFTESTLNKLDAFLSQEVLSSIVGQSRTTVNFREVMDTGKLLLVKLDAQLESITKLLGSVVVGQILAAALSRSNLPEAERRPFHLYADEYPFFATPSFAHLIDQARKYAVATTIAHQRRSQLDAAHRAAPLGAGNMVVFSVLGEDAQELAAEFDHTPPPPTITGVQEIRSPTQHPVEHLVQVGHRNQSIVPCIDTYLRPLYAYYANRPDWRPLALQSLTNYFRWVMQQHEQWQPGTDWIFGEAGYLATVAWCTREYFHARNHDFPPVYNQTIPKEHIQASLETLLHMLVLLPNAIPTILDTYEQAEQGAAATDVPLLPYVCAFTDWALPHQTVLSSLPPKPVMGDVSYGEREWTLKHWLEYMEGLHRIAVALAEDPILVTTGQVVPIYGVQRTYADMQNEIANSLITLPKYHARCKLMSGEYVLHTRKLPALVWDATTHATIERICEHSRATYCHAREAVADEIRHRQAAILTLPPYGNDILAEDDDEDYLKEKRHC